MELPFAVEPPLNISHPRPTSSSSSSHNKNVNSVSSNLSTSNLSPIVTVATSAVARQPSSQHNRSHSAASTLPTISPHSYQNVNVSMQQKQQHYDGHGTSSSTSATTTTKSTAGTTSPSSNPTPPTTVTATTAGNILHRVALYDNVHPQFYSSPPIPPSLDARNHHTTVLNHDSQSISTEDEFVTICESDVAKEEEFYTNNYDPQQQLLPQYYYQHDIQQNHFKNINNYERQQKQQYNNGNTAINNNENDSKMVLQHGGILSLLFSSSSNNNTRDDSTTINGTSIVTLCEKASQSARLARSKQNKQEESIAQYTKAAKYYRLASLHIKEFQNQNKHMTNQLSLLAYSLLVLSHAQARSADALLRNTTGRGNRNKTLLMNTTKNNTATKTEDNDKNIKSAVKTDDNSSRRSCDDDNVDDAVKRANMKTSTKQDRLRATIRASMGTVEADITDSTFLGRASSSNDLTTIATSNNTAVQQDSYDKSKEGTTPDNNDNKAGKDRVSDLEEKVTGGNNKKKITNKSRNPVDDMMELERELRDMDIALEMGVGLNSINATNKKSVLDQEGSFCLVSPAESSHMSSSIMWASGFGGGGSISSGSGRPSQQQQQQQQIHPPPISHNGGGGPRARANRLSTHQNHHIQTTPKQQAVTNNNNINQGGLESSWWGQTSTLVQSTTLAYSTQLLSNSMIGIQPSSSSQQQQPFQGNDGGGIVTTQTPSAVNPTQVMRLLDSLQTLTDENASLMGQLEGAQKARLEAKAARESMKEFKQEYFERFAKLKAALNKVRKEQQQQQPQNSPNIHSDTGNSSPNNNNNSSSIGNIVSNSNYAKTELLKRDSKIQKLSLELKKEKDDSVKKDEALRKYENFYKEVKARSALKAKQREKDKKKAMMMEGVDGSNDQIRKKQKAKNQKN